MDDQRFDALARSLATGTSRRLILKGLIGGALGGMVRLVQRTGTLAVDPCPIGQAECNGRCVPSCPPNHIFGPQCQCICTLSDSHVCPNPLHVYDNCQCACDDDLECPGEQEIVDQETCACGCPPGLSCPPRFELDTLECECLCPIDECPGDQVLNADTCTCACPDWMTCPPDFLLDPVSCACVCAIGACPGALELDPVTCQCVCYLTDADCPLPIHELDPVACACVCPADRVCRGELVVDPTTCACACPAGTSKCRGRCVPACAPPYVRHDRTCECRCSTAIVCSRAQTLDHATCTCVCPDRGPCKGGLVPNPVTCGCDCPPGTTKCRDRCVPACAPPYVRNDRTCECGCPTDIACSRAQTLDPTTCACVCSNPRPCKGGLVPNPVTCGCDCPPGTFKCGDRCLPPCPRPKVRNDRTCECGCPPGITCPAGQSVDRETCLCVRILYTPVGVQTNVPVSTLTGWSQCYVDKYNNSSTSLAAIQAACPKAKLLLACRPTGAATLSVLAWAPRADVLFGTGQGNTPHNANNVGWYFDGGWSWGFAPQGDVIKRVSCDVKASSFDATGGNGDKRLCWHTLAGNIHIGWRCGTADSLNGTTYERLVFQAD